MAKNKGLAAVKTITPPPEGEVSAPQTTGYDSLWIAERYMEELGYVTDADTQRAIAQDDQVQTAFSQRIARTVAREWYTEPGGDSAEDIAAAAHVEAQLNDIDFDGVSKKMLGAVMHGYSIAEVIWGERDGLVVIQDIKVRNRDRFTYKNEMGVVDGWLRLKTPDGRPGVAMPSFKFWEFCFGAAHSDNPYGVGLTQWLKWPVVFKRGTMKSWLRFLDKYAMPTAMGKFQPGASEEEKKKLLEALKAISTNAGIIIPQGMEIDLLEATRGGQAEYSALYDRMNQAINQVILTQTMTTSDGGSYSQAKVHQEVSNEVVKGDADALMQSFNRGVVRWLTMWNFPTAKPPKVWRRITPEPSVADYAAMHERMARFGYQPGPDLMKQIYGPGYQPASAPASSMSGAFGGPPAAFSEAAGSGPDPIELEAARLAEQSGPLMADRIQDIVTRLRQTGDLAAFAEQLDAMRADQPSPEMINAIQQSGLRARVGAMAQVGQMELPI